MLAFGQAAHAQDDNGIVANDVAAFRNAQFTLNAGTLKAFCADDLSYSHSDGHIEDKATFVTNATNGRYVFNALEYQGTTVHVVDTTAIVRFKWVARQTWKDGKITDTQMAIMMVWHKQGQEWKLLARSATKL